MTERLDAEQDPRVQREATGQAFELPRLIDTPYPSIAIGDLSEITSYLVSDINPGVFDALEEELAALKQEFAPPGATFYFVSAASLGASLEAMAATQAARDDRKVGVVHLDKFIGTAQQGPQFTRLELSRNPDNELVSRVGTAASPEEQFARLIHWATQGELDELLFVDDVIAFGNTLPPIIQQLREALPDTKFGILAGIVASGGVWRGLEKTLEETGIEPRYLTKVLASEVIEGGSKGMAIPVSRDLTLLGGKTSRLEDGTEIAHPYFLPFSKPMVSLIDGPRKLEASHAFINFNTVYINILQTALGRELTIGDLQAARMGTPFTTLECLKDKMELPTPETRLLDYLNYARTILDEHATAILEECNVPPK